MDPNICEIITDYLPDIPGVDRIGFPAGDIDRVLRFPDTGTGYTREGFYYFQDAAGNTLCIEQLWRDGYYQLYFPGDPAYDVMMHSLTAPRTCDGKLH